MHFTNRDIQDMNKVRRLNIINSVSGIKPGNLIGTISTKGLSNVAIFSSVVHLGSNPALFGFIIRPVDDVPRHTYENIIGTNCYTINAIPNHLVKNAHYTSAKFGSEISEFERCAIEEKYLPDFSPPFVRDSPIQIGLTLQDILPIPVNGTKMIIGKVEHLIISDRLLDEKGYIDLSAGELIGIGGLNNYYNLTHKEQHPYARVDEVPIFK